MTNHAKCETTDSSSSAFVPGKAPAVEASSLVMQKDTNAIILSMKDSRETNQLPGLSLTDESKAAKERCVDLKDTKLPEAVTHSNESTDPPADKPSKPGAPDGPDGGRERKSEQKDKVEQDLENQKLDEKTKALAKEFLQAYKEHDIKKLQEIVNREAKDSKTFHDAVWAVNYAFFRNHITDIPMTVSENGTLVLPGMIITPDKKASQGDSQ